MRKLSWLLLMALGFGCGHKKRDDQEPTRRPTPPVQSPVSPGCLVDAPERGVAAKSIVVAGTKRTYLISVPKDYDHKKPHRLVFGWHGLGLSGQQMQKDFVSQLEAKSADDAIFVYPDAAINGAKRSLDASPNGPDVKLFDALVTNLAQSHCIDPSKVFSVGFSNGGFFTNALAQARPKAVRGIISIAGGGGGGSTPVAAMIVHSVADGTVGIGNGYQSATAWGEAAGCKRPDFSTFPLNKCVSLSGCKLPVSLCIWGPTQPGQGTHDWPRFTSANDDLWGFLAGL